MAARGAIGQELVERCAPDATSLGLELLNVAVRDIMVPGELKRAYAAVLAARKEGESGAGAGSRGDGEPAQPRQQCPAAR